jgi:hypothetical protein
MLPADLLKKVAEGSRDLAGLSSEHYHLPDTERISTAVSRAWTRLRTAWSGFKAATAGLGQGDLGIGLTREKWLLQLFQALDYGRLQTAKGLKVKDKVYAISHLWRTVPIHLVGFRVDLDRRQKGVAGAAKISPHGLIQDYLNQELASLWGMVSNGLRLRLLRDNVSLTWSDQAREQGIRVMDSLRQGVEAALKVLGKGFVSHKDNGPLRKDLRDGKLKNEDFYRQLLRVVYRLLFLFVAEDRKLLLDPQASEKAKAAYGYAS